MRKKIILLYTLLFLLSFCFAQAPVTKIDAYSFHREAIEPNTIVVKMLYATATVESIEGDTAQLQRAGAVSVDIVCTDYPSRLSLSALNEARLQTLFRLFPYLKKEQLKTVNLYRQTNGAERHAAQTLFHGLVVRYRPRQDKETMKKDISKLEEMLNPTADPVVVEDSAIKVTTSLSVPKGEEIYDESVSASTLLTRNKMQVSCITSEVILRFAERPVDCKDADSMAVITPQEGFKTGLLDKEMYKTYAPYKKITIFFKRSAYVDYAITDIGELSDSSAMPSKPLPDSTLFKIFDRNHWKNTAVVGDVTGSMYPYSAQLLLWLKLNSTDKLTNRFSFFNDGDEKRDDEKTIGSIKGIYTARCNSFNQIKELLLQTMQKGGGGDAPENNVEALLRTEEAYPEIDYTVLIADNWAALKDKALIPQLKKPVRVVLCGVYNNQVNVDYLDLARKTGGSLHLIEQDLFNLAKLHEGEEIKIGFRRFIISKGEFVEVKEG